MEVCAESVVRALLPNNSRYQRQVARLWHDSNLSPQLATVHPFCTLSHLMYSIPSANTPFNPKHDKRVEVSFYSREQLAHSEQFEPAPVLEGRTSSFEPATHTFNPHTTISVPWRYYPTRLVGFA
jgi:hypothetical protein